MEKKQPQKAVAVTACDVMSYIACGAHCAFEITLLQAIMLTLLLVCAFFSTQVQKYLAWVL